MPPASLGGGGKEEVTILLVWAGAGGWEAVGEVAMRACARAGSGAQPEVKMQGGDVVSCRIRLVLNILWGAGYANWPVAVAASSVAGIQNGWPPWCGGCERYD